MEAKGIYSKLLEVQKEVAPIKKTEDNPFFKSKYFDVNAILAALKPILSAHGLVLTQGIEANEGKNVLTSIVTEVEGGNRITSTIYLPDASDPQKFGSAVTYYRRYALQSLFALEAEDDDGNSATGSVSTPPARSSQKPPSRKAPASDAAMLDEIEWQLKLESVGNTAELKRVWDLLPVEAKNALGGVKEKLKEQFAKAGK